MKMNDIQEIEFKWEIPSQKHFKFFLEQAFQLRANLSPEHKICNHDYYLDTNDRLFGLTRTSCRLRQTHHRWELTLKVSSELKKGLAVRREKTYRLPSCKTLKEALQYTERKILRLTLNKKHLRTLFEIKNNRTERILSLPQKTQAQICFDDVKISRKRKEISMHEIELEFLKGNISRFKSFIRSVNRNSSLKPSRISKVATALMAFSLRVPSPLLGLYIFSKFDRLSYAAHQNLKKHFEILRLKEPFVRVGLNEDSVHDMRVAARRLRATLKVFKNIRTSKAFHISKDLAWLGKKLGSLRDLNIHEAFLNQHKPRPLLKHCNVLENYHHFIYAKIHRARNALLTALNSKKYKRLLYSLEKLIRETSHPHQEEIWVDEALKKILKKSLKKSICESRKLRPRTKDHLLHQFRIRIKKLRYAIEFFKPVLSSKFNRMMEHTIGLQDLLGLHQDSCIHLNTLSKDLAEINYKPEDVSKLKEALYPFIKTARKTRDETRLSFFKIIKKWQREISKFDFEL